MIVGAESAWPTVAGAAIGAAAALVAALVAKLRIGEKRRWDDVASAFVAEARWIQTYSRRLGTDTDKGASAPHRRVRAEKRGGVLAQAEDHLFEMRNLFVRLKLLAPP